MPSSAMYSLHGFTMAFDPATPHLVHHGPPGTYVRTLDDIHAELVRWEAGCVEYDRDPQAWRAKQLSLAQAYFAAERQRNAAQGE